MGLVKKNQKGVALIEALVAAVIVGIGFVAVFGLASTSTRVLMSAIDREKQNMLANMIYEDLLTDTANIINYHNMDFKTSSGGSTSHDKKRAKWFNSANKKLGSTLTNDKRKIEVVKKTKSGKDFYVVTIRLASRDGKASNHFKRVINAP
tara:strand:+ start:44 stop:493 length:450 start_codon:yes stop_codon:yes gene_type:complete